MKLIVKSGSSKTEWTIVEGRHLIDSAISEGINPFFQNRRDISRSIRLGLPAGFFKKKLEQIYFYGAGCSSEEKKNVLQASLIAQFHTPTEVESDLLAAARGLFIDRSGIACILGTGSNSCLYDGEKIVTNVKAAGYILGDEGSFAALGKSFLSDVLKEIAPGEIADRFYRENRLDSHIIMENIYDLPFPHRFLMKAADFLDGHITNDYVHTLITQNIRNFFIRNVCRYEYKKYPIRFVGKMAVRYADILKNVAREFDITIDRIQESPMKGLIEYHAGKTVLPL
ncbi:MAG: hypothetical protein LBC47_08035 [Tannerella sp.]|jgi:N-acetylglucosamine kinase-like BadF-type ATPase|nr:hypothetical protein [Tannerella sp.]